MKINTVGSVCSGIETASLAWNDLNLDFKWFSEIEDFPSRLLEERYPGTPNLGDMNNIPKKILEKEIDAPDLICGGTPCQAFSLAGLKKGLTDERGNLTLKFVDIIEANDLIRKERNEESTIVLWENVEGVLKDKTNAFGSLISALAGLDDVFENTRWPNSGILKGPKRNLAWRVIDAKHFGMPQQRRRLYLIAGGKDFEPEQILFEEYVGEPQEFPKHSLTFNKDGHSYEVFREYTDCLYSAYGTKWNGNAAAYNGSLFVAQDDRLRRLSPLECERLMGIPDNYTDIEKASRTKRYQAIGNAWSVPVIKWIGNRITEYSETKLNSFNRNGLYKTINYEEKNNGFFVPLDKKISVLGEGLHLNTSAVPNKQEFGRLKDVVTHHDVPEKIFISPTGCHGILRRSQERTININSRLKKILSDISKEEQEDVIERNSMRQKRGQFSISKEQKDCNKKTNYQQLSIL